MPIFIWMRLGFAQATYLERDGLENVWNLELSRNSTVIRSFAAAVNQSITHLQLWRGALEGKGNRPSFSR